MSSTLHTTRAATSRAAPTLAPSLDEVIEHAWRFVAPLWPLSNFVAVNPFGGLTDLPYPEAACRIDEIFHARAFLPAEQHRAGFVEGAVNDGDLAAAAREVAPLESSLLPQRAPVRVLTYAEAADRRYDTRIAPAIVDELGKWCAARFDQGQAAWTQPGRDLDLWSAFVACARIERGPELRGIKGFRAYIATLPRDPRAAIELVLEQLGVPRADRPDYCARALATVRGWAGHVRYRARQAGLHGEDDRDELAHFLAARLAYEGALFVALGPNAPRWPELVAGVAPPALASDEAESATVWQHALERSYRRRLQGRLTRGPSPTVPVGAPSLQAVFCIDVRSEVFRRHLEDISARVQTIGFAGFFGFPIEWRRLAGEPGGARCPALIAPSHRVREVAADGGDERRSAELARHRAAQAARLSTVSSFTFAETVGQWFGLRVLTDALGLTSPGPDGALFRTKVRGRPELAPAQDGDGPSGLDLDARVQLAEGALRGMGLVEGFASVVLVCGHGSKTSNNPFGSGLDCGACGGHAGDVNARVAVAVFNDPEVRARLRERGIDIPASTRFVAGLHETTTDRVELLDTDGLDLQVLAQIQAWLHRAGSRTRAERLRKLGCETLDRSETDAEAERRSRDWSEVRPEWGLAGNAAFVAARRMRTRGVDLEGRVFLHDYDPELDEDRSWLTGIMTAPMVVATWINMQYYASAVDNEVFGAGDKVLHNVVGRHGVLLGNRGDLQVGLPKQSVQDGRGLVHEPLRLQVVIEAWPEHIDEVLAAHEEVRTLVDNGWITLVAWHPGKDEMSRRRAGGGWVREA